MFPVICWLLMSHDMEVNTFLFFIRFKMIIYCYLVFYFNCFLIIIIIIFYIC